MFYPRQAREVYIHISVFTRRATVTWLSGLGHWIWNLEVPGSNPSPYCYLDLFLVVASSTQSQTWLEAGHSLSRFCKLTQLNHVLHWALTTSFDLIKKYLLSFLSKGYKPALVRNSSLIQPGRNMSKLLNAIMTNYDKNIRPFYGGKRECMSAGTCKVDVSNFYIVMY